MRTMELTGKCKQDFEVYSINNEEIKFKNILGLFCVKIYGFWVPFYLMPFPMQFGFMQDFADSKGFQSVVNWDSRPNNTMFFEIYCKGWSSEEFNDRHSARLALVKRFDNYYNSAMANPPV